METFTLSDIDLTAYLLASGFKFAKPPYLSARNPRIVFTFKNSEKLEQAIQEFRNRQASVEPIAFAECLRSLRTQMLDLRTGGEQ